MFKGKEKKEKKTKTKDTSKEKSKSGFFKKKEKGEVKIGDPEDFRKKDDPQLTALQESAKQGLNSASKAVSSPDLIEKREKLSQSSPVPTADEDEEIDENDYIRSHALYDYDPAEEDEIGLRVGDVVFIFHKHESGWWTGECNGKYGIFPGAYVQEDEDQTHKKLPSSELSDSQQEDARKAEQLKQEEARKKAKEEEQERKRLQEEQEKKRIQEEIERQKQRELERVKKEQEREEQQRELEVQRRREDEIQRALEKALREEELRIQEEKEEQKRLEEEAVQKQKEEQKKRQELLKKQQEDNVKEGSKRVQELEADIGKLSEENLRLHSELTRIREENETLSVDRDTFKLDVETYLSQVSSLTVQLEEKEASILQFSQAQRELSGNSGEVQQLRSSNAALQNELSELKAARELGERESDDQSRQFRNIQQEKQKIQENLEALMQVQQEMEVQLEAETRKRKEFEDLAQKRLAETHQLKEGLEVHQNNGVQNTGGEIKELERDLLDLKGQLESEKKNNEKTQTSLNNRIAEMEKSLTKEKKRQSNCI